MLLYRCRKCTAPLFPSCYRLSMLSCFHTTNKDRHEFIGYCFIGINTHHLLVLCIWSAFLSKYIYLPSKSNMATTLIFPYSRSRFGSLSRSQKSAEQGNIVSYQLSIPDGQTDFLRCCTFYPMKMFIIIKY